jgi:anti-sigma-K factor RskA
MATLFWDTKTKDVYIMPNKLPKVEDDKQYQLWALVDGKPVDAGVLDPRCGSVCKMKNIPAAQAFAITLEKAGGSPTPTLSAMYVMGKV